MGVDLSLKTFIRLGCRTSSDAIIVGFPKEMHTFSFTGSHLTPQNRWFSSGNPYILALLMGVDLSLKTFIRRGYRTSSDAIIVGFPKEMHTFSFTGSHLTPQKQWFS